MAGVESACNEPNTQGAIRAILLTGTHVLRSRTGDSRLSSLSDATIGATRRKRLLRVARAQYNRALAERLY